MPRTVIPVQASLANTTALTPTFGATDSTNNMMFVNDGDVHLHVKNASGASITVTHVSVPDPYGRLGDIITTVPAGAERIIPCVSPSLFNQTSGADAGNVYVNFSASASVTVGAFKLLTGR